MNEYPVTSVSLSPEAVAALRPLGVSMRDALEAVFVMAGALEPADEQIARVIAPGGFHGSKGRTVIPFRLSPGVAAVHATVKARLRNFSRWANFVAVTYPAEARVYLFELSDAERAEVANLAISRAAPLCP